MLGWKHADYGGPPALEPVAASGVEIAAPDVVAEPYGTVRLSAQFTPEETSYKRVDWSVAEPDGSPTDKAVIDDDGALTVNHRDGDVLVRAVAADGGGASATKLVRIELDPGRLRANAARWPGVTASASSAYSDDYRAENVFDGVTGQWAVGEWASRGEQDPWIQLDWEKPIRADQILLYDRSIPEDVNGGTLSFSDGSTVEVTGVPADGRPKTVSFPLKTFSWVRFQVQGGTGANVGLSEIELRAVPVAPDAPLEVQATGSAAEATVSWHAPAFDGGAPLTGYVVTPYRDGEALPPISVGADATSVVVPGLSPDQPYRFTVAARNLLGTGVASPPTDPITPS
jgi:Fibronectin type III domain/F5/8 type C domain